MKKNIDNFKIFYSSFLGKAVSEILSKKISKLWNPIDKSRIAVIGFGSPYSESINKRIQRLFSVFNIFLLLSYNFMWDWMY